MLRLFAKEPHYDFMGKRWIGFAISFLMILISLFFLATHGLNWGIDFTGGVLMEIRMEKEADLGKLRPLFPEKRYGEVSLQHFGNNQEVMLRLELAEGQNQAALIEKVKQTLTEAGWKAEYRKIDYVGPTVGKELIRAGVLSLGLAILGIMAYVWFRFEWQYGVGGVLALAHDLVWTLGFYAFSGHEFGLPSIAALLTILGYSINDSVVLFDRVRDMRRKYKKMPLEELLNKAININLGRTVMTALTVILASLALTVAGGDVLRSFSAAILFGVTVGVYSSIYISVPVLIYLGMGNNETEQAGDKPLASQT